MRQYIEDLSESSREIYISDLKEECKSFGLDAQTENAETMCRTVIELAFASKANSVIIPMWDVLAMGGESRINLPSTVSEKNWSWRFVDGDFSTQSLEFLKQTAEKTGRFAKTYVN